MFRKLTIAVVPALMFALATFTSDSASLALAKGGHGGGHRGGGHHAVSHRSGGHRSVAHKTSLAKKSPKGHSHWRRYGRFGLDAGVDGDVDFAADADVLDSITLLNPQETRDGWLHA